MVIMTSVIVIVLFFKKKTAYEMRISDWSSDVCSSDLLMRLSLPALDQSAAECDVERDKIVDLRAAQLDQRLFGREQIALGVEHFEIGRNALARKRVV